MDFLNKIKSGLKSIFSIDAGSFVNPQNDVSGTGFGGSVLKVGNAVKKFAVESGQGLARSAARTELSVLNTVAKQSNKRLGTNLPTNLQFDPNKYQVTKKIFGQDDSFGNDLKSIKDVAGTLKDVRSNTKEGTLAYSLAPVAVYGGTALDLIPGFGKGSKSLVEKIAKETADSPKIVKYLLELGVNKNIAEEIAPKLTSVSEPRDVAFLVKNAEVVSRIESNTGKVLPSSIRKKIGEDIAQQKFASEKDAELYFNKLINEVSLTAPKKQKLLSEYQPLQELVKKTDSQKQWLEEVNTMFTKFDDAEKTGKEIKDIPGYQAYLTFKQEMQETGRTLNDIYNITKKELKDTPVQKKIDSIVAPKTPDTKVEVARPMTKLKRELKAQEKAGDAGFRRGVTEGKKIATTKERQVAKDRVLAVYEKVKAKQETMKALREEVRVFANELPASQRNKILSKKRFSEIKSEKQFFELLYDIEKETKRLVNRRLAKEKLFEFRGITKKLKEKGLDARSRKELGEKFGVKSLTKIKQQLQKLGLSTDGTKEELHRRLKASAPAVYEKIPRVLNTKMVERMSAEKIESINMILKKNFDNPVQNVGEKYAAVSPKKASNQVAKSSGRGAEKTLGILSTNIGKISKELMYSLRRREKNIIESGNKYGDVIKPFSEKIQKLGKESFFSRGNKKDYNIFSGAVANQDFDTARKIAQKYNFLDEFNNVVKMLDEIHAGLKEAGVDVGKLPNFFPRSLNSYDDYYEAYVKKFGKEGENFLNQMIKKAESKKYGAELTDGEKFDLITNSIRGYGEKINTGTSKLTLARKVREIDPEFMQFYLPPDQALLTYVDRAIKTTETAKVFKKFGKNGVERADADSIGAIVSRIDGLTPEKARRLQEMMLTYFVRNSAENAAVKAIRNSIYITQLTHITTIITQLSDPVLYLRKGGFFNYISAFFKEKPYRMEELTTNAMVEMSGGKITNGLLTGLTIMDKTLGNAGVGKLLNDAQNAARKGSGEYLDDILRKASWMFPNEPKKVDKLIDDLKNNRKSDEVKEYIFNEISDIRPATILDMPEAYVKHPNSRIFYALKTWQLKLWDVYRKETFAIAKENPAKAAKNFVRLTALMVTAGATTSQIKAYWSGKDEEWSDSFINNTLNIALLSRYDAKTFKQDGVVSTLADKVIPAVGWVSDLSSDVATAGDNKGLQSIRNIPVVGREIYNRFGRGARSIEKNNNKKYSPKEISNRYASGTLTVEDKKKLAEMKKNNPSQFSNFKKELRYEKMGLTDKERKFANMGVEDGERANAIWKYAKNSDDPMQIVGKLKAAGIVTPEVLKQIAILRTQ